MMVKFYIGDALIYPVEVSRELLKEGYYIPLTGGALLYAHEENDALWIKKLQGDGGQLYGVEEQGRWATSVGGQALEPMWMSGKNREEAIEESKMRPIVKVGSFTTALKIELSASVIVEGPRARLEPTEATAKVGETATLKLVSLPVGHTFYAEANGAKVEVEGSEIKVTPLQHDDVIQLKVALTDNVGATYRLNAKLIPMEGQDGMIEAPIPPEAAEPATNIEDEIDYETVLVKDGKAVVELPTFKKVTHRRRGPRESEKLNAYLIGMRRELLRLDAKQKSIASEMKMDLGQETQSVNLIDEEKIVLAHKPEGVKVVRLGLRCARVVSSSVKLNGTSLNSTDYVVDRHGIMILSDQFAALSGRIEALVRYERTNESPKRLSMDELKRRARRLEEKMCRVKEGIENG
ncbi:hypothetical protein C0431_12330 [bacterium]|nr:hypothetical protein [bacterium]